MKCQYIAWDSIRSYSMLWYDTSIIWYNATQCDTSVHIMLSYGIAFHHTMQCDKTLLDLVERKLSQYNIT